MANESIKQEIVKAGLRFWQIADALGIYDSTFSKKLRKELPDTEKMRIQQVIKELSRKEA